MLFLFYSQTGNDLRIVHSVLFFFKSQLCWIGGCSFDAPWFTNTDLDLDTQCPVTQPSHSEPPSSQSQGGRVFREEDILLEGRLESYSLGALSRVWVTCWTVETSDTSRDHGAPLAHPHASTCSALCRFQGHYSTLLKLYWKPFSPALFILRLISL